MEIRRNIYIGHRCSIWDSIDESWQEVIILDIHIEGDTSFYLVRDLDNKVFSKQIKSADEIRPAKPAKVYRINKVKLKLIKSA